jgi:hypothetical protein
MIMRRKDRSRHRYGPLAGWALLIAAALLPIALLSLYSYQLNSSSVRRMVRANNRSAAQITAQLVSEDLWTSRRLAASFASLPDVIRAVGERDEPSARAQLEALVQGFPRVDRAFVTDLDGVLWSDYPPASESMGENFSHRDWFDGVSRQWQPYVSEVYQRHAAPRPLVLALATPIRREQEMLGILV